MPGHDEQPQGMRLPPEQVGGFTFEIAADDTPEARERWEGRIDTLVAWLLAEWQREQMAAIAERN